MRKFWFEKNELSSLDSHLVLILGLGSLLIYVLTLCPTVASGDSGELTAVAYTLGISHPPGYPLHALLGKLFTFIPYGSIAWRVNFLSAFCSALSVLVLFYLTRLITKNSWASFFTAFFYGLSPIIWRYSVVAEVFSLNNLFIMIFLYLSFILWRQLEKKVPSFELESILYVGAFVFGLALTNHHTFILIALPLTLLILTKARRQLLRFKTICLIIFCFLLGLLPYSYLILMAAKKPIISWTDTSHIKGLIHHLLRKDYGTFQLGANHESGQLIKGLFLFFKELPKYWYYVLLILPVVGLYQKIKNEKGGGIFTFTLMSFVFYLVVFHALANLPLDNPLFFQVHIRFWAAAQIFIFLWTGVGLAFFWQKVPKDKEFLLPIGVVFMLFIQFTTNFKNEDQHENWTTHTLGKMVLDTLPENALFLSIGDVYTNSVRYLQFCENYRTDVKVMDRELMKKPWFNNLVKVHYPELNIPGEKFRPGSLGDDKNYHLKMLLDANTSRFPVYGANFKKDSPENNDRRWQKAYYRLPYGTIHRFFKRSDTLDLNKYLSDSEHILAQIKLLKFQKVTEGNWEYLIWKDFQNAGYFRGRQLLYLAQKDRNQVLINQAIPMLEEVSKNHPEPPWENFKILGAAYNWRKKKTIGETKKMLSAWDRYFELSPHDDKDRVEIERSYSVYKKKLAEELAKRSDSKSNSKKSIILN